MGKLQHPFSRVERLNQSSPVESQSTMDRFPTQYFVHFFIGFLSQWCCHPIGCIQSSQRSYSVNTTIFAINKSLPAHIFQIAELYITPWLNMLTDVVKVFLGGKFGKLLTVRVDHSYLAIVEVDLIVLIHLSHIISPVLEDIPDDKVNIVFIF